MQPRWTLPRLTLLGLGLVASLAAADAPARPRAKPAREGASEADDAEGRRAWNRYWFGDITPEYLAFKNQAAAKEVSRWRGTFPQPAGSFPLPSLSVSGTWNNLGPHDGLGQMLVASASDIDSGRPVSVVTDPTDAKILYLAISGGGVWKSTNADLTATGDWTWTPITDSLPASSATGNVSVGALAMSPADHLTLFLGLGDAFDAAGTGVYKTADGGATWTAATLTGATPTRTKDILALDANIILVATDAGLFRSTNGGTSFALVGGGLGAGEVWSVQSFSATELICTVQDAAGAGTLWYSSDAGATWTQATGTLTSPGRITVATSPASTTQAWGIYEDTSSGDIERGLLKTTDKGHTWTFVAAPTVSGGLFQGIGGSMSSDGGQGFYNHGLAIDPTNINNVFVGANLALYRTLNGGTSWQQMTHWYGDRHVYAHADFHCASWAKTGTKTLFVGNDGGLCIVRDPLRASIPTGSGAVTSDPTFIDNRRNKGLASHLVYNLGSTTAASPAGAQYEISIGLQDNGTRIRQGSGAALQTSSTFDEGVGGDGFGTVIHQTDGTKMLGTIYYADVYRSIDSGANFNESISGITESGDSSNAPFHSKVVTGQLSVPDTVYTFTNPKVYKSTNWATSWTAMSMTGFDTATPTGIIRNINASHGTSAVGIASNGGRFFLSYNGTSWTTAGDITGGTLNTSYVWFDTTNDQIVYGATVAPSGSAHHLYKSTNGGVSWTFIDQTSGGADNGFPFGIPVHVIQNDPTDHNALYAGTDFGVYRSTDAGATWARYGTGLPMVAVRDLYIATDGSFIRAATFGRGVWEMLAAQPITVALNKTSATLAVSASTSFTATLTNTTTDNTANWTATSGSFSLTNTASGSATSYTAPATVGTFTVTATSVEDGTKKATAAITTYNPATLAVAVTPGSKTLMTGGTQTFTATVTGAPNNNVAWSASGGTITSAGVYTAPATAGTYTVTATAPYPGGVNGTATVTVRTLDLNADTKVDAFDLLSFAKVYGPAPAPADFNGDGVVDDTDLGLLLAGIQ